jgi:hypothetical protein
MGAHFTDDKIPPFDNFNTDSNVEKDENNDHCLKDSRTTKHEYS